MNEETRLAKEAQYLDAAERVFEEVGFSNTKMSDIAKAGGCSKPTLYNYFASKENLYMAITFRAFESLLEKMKAVVKKHASGTGFDAAVDLFWAYQQFSESHFFYHQLLLEHLNLVRSLSNQKEHPWLTDAMKSSPWFQKVMQIQNEPLMISVAEIQRGQADGSIRNRRNPVEIYLTAWAFMIGFTKINLIASGTIYQYPIGDWKEHVFAQVRGYLSNPDGFDTLDSHSHSN